MFKRGYDRVFKIVGNMLSQLYYNKHALMFPSEEEMEIGPIALQQELLTFGIAGLAMLLM